MTVNISLKGEFTGGRKGTGVKPLMRKPVTRSTDELGGAMTTHSPSTDELGGAMTAHSPSTDEKAGHLKGINDRIGTHKGSQPTIGVRNEV